MSRFYTQDSDTDSSSNGDELPRPGIALNRPFQMSDDEEETKRIVRSAKDKRFEELRNIIKKMKNHKKNQDMSRLVEDFEEFAKAYEKARKVVDKEGIPQFYIRTLAQLENYINESWDDRESRKSMSKTNAKGLTSLRAKIRKYNKMFEDEIAEFKETEDWDNEKETEEEEESASDDEVPLEIKTPQAVRPREMQPDDVDSSDWGSDDSDSSDTGSAADEFQFTLDYFRKKDTDEKDDKKKSKTERQRKVNARKDADTGAWTEVTPGTGAPMEKPRMFNRDAEITIETVLKKLAEITSARGKKGTDRSDQIELLKELRKIANANDLGVAMDCKLLYAVVGAIFDYNPNIATCMQNDKWELCIVTVRELLELLDKNPSIFCSMTFSDEMEKVEGEGPYKLRGCVLATVERLNEEFTKMLQACDAHSTEYVERLKDEQQLCVIIKDVQSYLEGETADGIRRSTNEELCRIYMMHVSHLYYKYESGESAHKTEKLMANLCQIIYTKDLTDRIRTQAILCHIYHHAMHNRWYQARDIMLMSHLQESIQHADITTQILYNRAMVQLGLCAFRKGLIKDAHNCLVDMQSGGRAKELLAQGLLMQRQSERTPEQEKIERRRMMPYHMHINLELLECSYLVSAMLIEIPYMAAHEFDARRRMISKNFHHVLRVSERQTLVGPPESMREHVVAACKAMKCGQWVECRDLLFNEKMNSKVWSLYHDSSKVKDLLIEKIQEESLRTYLFTYSSVYDSLSLHSLSEMFDLPKATVHSIISKMIINEELMASMDEPSQAVVMHRTEPSKIQALSLQLADKISSLVDNNDQTFKIKQGAALPFQKQGWSGMQSSGQMDYRSKSNNYNKLDRSGMRSSSYRSIGTFNNRLQGFNRSDRKMNNTRRY